MRDASGQATSLQESALSGQPVPLTGAQRVAALLYTLPRDTALRLLQRFEGDEIEMLHVAAASMPAVNAAEIRSLVEILRYGIQAAGLAAGSIEKAEDLFPKPEAPPASAEDSAPAVEATVWGRFSALGSEELALLLAALHPQVLAYVCSRLPPEGASQALMSLKPDLRASIARRMVRGFAVSILIEELVERHLGTLFGEIEARGAGNEAAASFSEVVANLERDEADQLIEAIETMDAKAADVIREKLFNFDDIALLQQRARVVLFDKVPIEQVIVALNGADPAVSSAVLGSLAARARKMVEQELRDAAAPNPKVVSAARRSIAQVVVELAAKGVIDRTLSKE